MKNNIDFLYKYTDFNAVVSILNGSSLRWASPKTFNDEYELKIMPIINLKIKEKNQIKKIKIKKQEVKKIFLKNVDLKKMKIVSFTSLYNNKLMWKNYANNYQGCILKFSTVLGDNNLFALARKMKYVNIKRKITYNKLFDNTVNHSVIGNLIIDSVIFTKEYKWYTENEYRIIHPGLPTKNVEEDYAFIEFDKKSLVSVTIGKEMTEKNRIEIENIIKTEYPDTVLLYQED